MKIYAKCPPNKSEYLTSGKEYEVLWSNDKTFVISDDEGDVINEDWLHGHHVGGKWECIVRDDAGDDTLTIRDRFAMAALNGFCSNGANNDSEGGTFFARMAYQIADAMMEARKAGFKDWPNASNGSSQRLALSIVQHAFTLDELWAIKPPKTRGELFAEEMSRRQTILDGDACLHLIQMIDEGWEPKDD